MKKYILTLICLLSITPKGFGEDLTTPENKQIIEINTSNTISLDEQIKEIDSKLINEPNNYDLYYKRALIYYNKSYQNSDLPNNNESFKYIKLAVEDFEKSIKLNPEYSQSYIYLSLSMLKVNNVLNNILLELGKDFDKNKYMEKLANKRSLSRFGRVKLEKMGREYNNLLQNIKGLEQTVLLTKKYSFDNLKKAEELNSNNPLVYNAYSYYYINDLDFKKAHENIDKSLAIEPRNHIFYNTQGIIYLAEKNYKSSEDSFKIALELEPNNIEYTINLSNLYLKTKETEKLFNLLNKSLELGINHKTFKKLYLSGFNLLSNNTLRENTLNSLINDISNKENYNDLVFESYLIIASHEGSISKSMFFIKKSLDIDPTNIKAKGLISKKYLDESKKEKNINKKIKILETALKESDNSKIKLELAKNYKLNKNYDKSIEKYNELIKSDNLNADNYYQLALLYAIKKDKNKFKSNLSKAISLDKKFKKISKKEHLFDYFRYYN